MHPAPALAEEARRVQAVIDLGLLDSAREERFDQLTRLAALALGTPIALIALIDHRREWLTSAFGTNVTEIPREVGFGAHALVFAGDRPFVIEDAGEDPRFAGSPLVVGEPHVSFYAGQPLRDHNGIPVGALCVIDQQPRRLAPTHADILIEIAALVEAELRRTAARDLAASRVNNSADIEAAKQREDLEEALRRSERTARVSLDALEQGVLLADLNGVIHRINPAAERILGYTADELAGRWNTPEWETFDADGRPMPFEQRPIVRALMSDEPVMGQIVGWKNRNGDRLTIRVSCIPNADRAGGLVVAFTDITQEHLAGKLIDGIFRAAPVGLAVLDTDRSILRCNPTFADQAGRPTEELIGLDAVELIHPDDRDAASAVGRELRFGQRRSGELDQRVLRPDGDERWVNTHLAVIPDSQNPLAIAATFDVTERRHMLLELSRFSYLFHHANDMITVIDAAGRQLYASPSAQRILGYPDGFRHPNGILGIIHPDDLEATITELTALIANTRGPEPFTVRVMSHTGEVRHVECVGVNLIDEPAVAGVVITARDVTERVRLTEQLAHRALHDTLTDLPNRQLLETAVERSLARAKREGTSIGLCFIDLDGFKIVNDTHGHAAGDELIVSVANRIRSTIRDGDLAARVGGDEFVVLLDSVRGPAQALGAASRLRENLILAQGGTAASTTSASIGVAISRSDDTMSSLLNRADAAMYRAKARRNSSVELAFDDGFVNATIP